MARKNNLKKRREYNDYLVQEEKQRAKERQEKLDQLKKLREKKKEIEKKKLEEEGEAEMADQPKVKAKKISKYERKRRKRVEKQLEMNED